MSKHVKSIHSGSFAGSLAANPDVVATATGPVALHPRRPDLVEDAVPDAGQILYEVCCRAGSREGSAGSDMGQFRA